MGETPLDPQQAHHARHVLRLPHGAAVEVFDDGGRVGAGVLLLDGTSPRVRVDAIEQAPAHPRVRLTVAAAAPKGDRADWMVEKLSELGVDQWIPLAAARSVVLPQGKGKRDRWTRIATEAAKQSRRVGVMQIGELTPLPKLLSAPPPGEAWCLSTDDSARPASELLAAEPAAPTITTYVGPEGGWTTDELTRFAAARVTSVSLTSTILRVETAAVVIASLVAVRWRGR